MGFPWNRRKSRISGLAWSFVGNSISPNSLPILRGDTPGIGSGPENWPFHGGFLRALMNQKLSLSCSALANSRQSDNCTCPQWTPQRIPWEQGSPLSRLYSAGLTHSSISFGLKGNCDSPEHVRGHGREMVRNGDRKLLIIGWQTGSSCK